MYNFNHSQGLFPGLPCDPRTCPQTTAGSRWCHSHSAPLLRVTTAQPCLLTTGVNTHQNGNYLTVAVGIKQSLLRIWQLCSAHCNFFCCSPPLQYTIEVSVPHYALLIVITKHSAVLSRSELSFFLIINRRSMYDWRNDVRDSIWC